MNKNFNVPKIWHGRASCKCGHWEDTRGFTREELREIARVKALYSCIACYVNALIDQERRERMRP